MNKKRTLPDEEHYPSFHGKGFIDKRTPERKMKDILENKVKKSPEDGDMYLGKSERLWVFKDSSWRMIN